MFSEWPYPCCCCTLPVCLGSKGCPAAENEKHFRKRCLKELDLEMPLTLEGRPNFKDIIEDINNSLEERERRLLAKQIGL